VNLKPLAIVSFSASLAFVSIARGQEPPPPPPPVTPPATAIPPATPTPPATVDQTNPPAPPPADNPQPSVLSGAASGAYDRRDSFPSVDLFLPEGQASVRLRKLIRNVLFESQIQYKFLTGDISTFLRYKYYARNFTYRLGVFDEIDFKDVGQSASSSETSSAKNEFERVRGGLLLFEFPRDYNRRYFWLVQDDRLTFGNICDDPTLPTCKRDVDDRKNNVYTKVGFQYGTQFDERLNAIVGETRGRITPVLTAFRELGPQKFSAAAAITESGRVATGDYKYTKLEGEGLRRFDISQTTFLISRLHAGFFATRGKIDPVPEAPIERYTIPRYEMFALGGREALRSISDDVDSEGTHEVHLTNEYFVPIFRNKDFRTWALHWNTMYGIGYLGAGSVGFDYRDVGKQPNTVVDAGLGFESSIAIRDFDVLFSVIYAQTIHAPEELKGRKVRFSIRTIR